MDRKPLKPRRVWQADIVLAADGVAAAFAPMRERLWKIKALGGSLSEEEASQLQALEKLQGALYYYHLEP